MRINFVYAYALAMASYAASTEVSLGNGCYLVSDSHEGEEEEAPDTLLKLAIDSFGGEDMLKTFEDFEKGVKIAGHARHGLSLVCKGVGAYDRFNAKASGNPYSCWKKTVSRGVGKPIRACPTGKEKSGLLCYPEC